MDIFQHIAEKRIQEAIDRGEFIDLPGEGDPLNLNENPFESPEMRMAFNLLENNGFKLKNHTIVHQLFADNLQEYYNKISLRGLSSLQATSDDDFQKGLSGLKKHCDVHETGEGIFEDIDLFIFNTY